MTYSVFFNLTFVSMFKKTHKRSNMEDIQLKQPLDGNFKSPKLL